LITKFNIDMLIIELRKFVKRMKYIGSMWIYLKEQSSEIYMTSVELFESNYRYLKNHHDMIYEIKGSVMNSIKVLENKFKLSISNNDNNIVYINMLDHTEDYANKVIDMEKFICDKLKMYNEIINNEKNYSTEYEIRSDYLHPHV